MHVNASVTFAGDRAGDVVANPKCDMAFALAFTQRSERIGGFSALADNKDERVAVERNIAVAKLAGKLAFDWDVGEGFDDVFPCESSMECASAADEHDAVDVSEVGVGHVQAT